MTLNDLKGKGIKKAVIIMVDLDSTIIDTSQTIINLYNKYNPNNKIKYTENHNWNFEPMIKTKEQLSELFKLFDSEYFYDEVIFKENALEVVHDLCEKYKVIICTKHNESRKPVTSKFIKRMFPKAELKFVDNFSDKGKIECDVAIDDKPESLNSFNDTVLKICFGDYVWNKSWDGVKMTNWLEIKEFFNN